MEFRLKELIEPDHGLLDHLLGAHVLRRNEAGEIRTLWKSGSKDKAIDKLLSYFNSWDGSFDDGLLLSSLEQTDQKHVANFIRCRGGDPYHEFHNMDAINALQ